MSIAGLRFFAMGMIGESGASSEPFWQAAS
jgi:hypothetical protein